MRIEEAKGRFEDWLQDRGIEFALLTPANGFRRLTDLAPGGVWSVPLGQLSAEQVLAYELTHPSMKAVDNAPPLAISLELTAVD